jgi:hypothetical protein
MDAFYITFARNCLDLPSKKTRINIKASHYITERKTKMLDVSEKSNEDNNVVQQEGLTGPTEKSDPSESKHRPAIRLENGSYDEFVWEE